MASSLLSHGSRFQLALELIEKAPIRTLGNNLIRAGFDEARFLHTQCIEPQRVLGIVLPPSVISDIFQRLQRILIAREEVAINQLLRNHLWISYTEVGCLEDG